MKVLGVVVMLFFSALSFGQTMPDFEMIRLENASDYKKAQPFAMQTAMYLLSTPVEKKNADNRQKSIEFLYKWMSGTPDHSFVQEEMFEKVGKDNKDILAIYIASMVKTWLEPGANKDAKLVKLKAINMLLDYCSHKDNNIKMNKQVKKLVEARQNGTLEQLL